VDSTERKSLIADLSAYLDGELSEQRTAEVDRVLAESDEARQILRELRSIASDLQALTHIKAPPSLAPAVEREAERKILLASHDVNRRSRLFSLVTRTSGAAAVILACGFGVWMVTHPGRDATSEEPLATGVIDQPADKSPGPADAGGFAGRRKERSAPPDAKLALARASNDRSLNGSSQDDDRKRTSSRSAGQRVAAATSRPPVVGVPLRNADKPAAQSSATASPPVVLGQTLDEIPSVSVLIAPTSPEEYRVAQEALTNWASQPPASGLGRFAAPMNGAKASIARVAATSAIDQAVDLERAADLMRVLEGRLPQHVRLTVSARADDMDRVYAIVASGPERSRNEALAFDAMPTTEAEEAADAGEAPAVAADAIRAPATGAALGGRATPSTMSEKRTLAKTSSDKDDDERESLPAAPRRARPITRGNEAARGGRGFRAPRSGEDAEALRRASMPNRDGLGPPATDAPPATAPAESDENVVTHWLLDGNAALDDWVGWLVDQAAQGLIEIAERVQAQQRAIGDDTVRLRVTLLRPPASQPTSAPQSKR